MTTPMGEHVLDEKRIGGDTSASVSDVPGTTVVVPAGNKLARWLNWLDEKTGLEQRGIERVPDELRHPKITTGGYVQMFIIWFSINCTVNNMTIGILGPVVYGLGLTDAML